MAARRGPSARPARGLALVETLLAIFVLTAAMVVSFSLYDVAMQHSAEIWAKQRAVLAAQREIARIQAWSETVNGVFTTNPGWSLYNPGPVTTSDPQDPGLKINVSAKEESIYSPDSKFESAFFSMMADQNAPESPPAGNAKRCLQDAAERVKVTVSWGAQTSQKITQFALITAPAPSLGWQDEDPRQAGEPSNESCAITLSPSGPVTLTEGQSVTFRAQVHDSSGTLVQQHPVVKWSVEPEGGNGTLTTDPSDPGNTAQARFANKFYTPDGTTVEYIPGSVYVQAKVRLGGRDFVQRSAKITNLGGATP